MYADALLGDVGDAHEEWNELGVDDVSDGIDVNWTAQYLADLRDQLVCPIKITISVFIRQDSNEWSMHEAWNNNIKTNSLFSIDDCSCLGLLRLLRFC